MFLWGDTIALLLKGDARRALWLKTMAAAGRYDRNMVNRFGDVPQTRPNPEGNPRTTNHNHNRWEDIFEIMIVYVY